MSDPTDWTTNTAIDPTELPKIVQTYLAAHLRHDIDAEVPLFGPGSTVTDDGTAYTGRDAIRAWLEQATTEYTYTSELVGAYLVDERHHEAVVHLEGDFPGGVADLHYRFTHDGARISTLVIGPRA